MAPSFLGSNELSTVAERQRLVDVLMDPATHAQKVLAGGQVVNVLTGEVYAADVAVEGRHIVMVGDCSDLVGPDTEVIDVSGKYLSPGFIDSHMHFESAMLTVTEFTRLSLPTGTTCLVSDPHEIGNVLGPVGIRAMCDEAALMPQHVHSRVPALTPDSPAWRPRATQSRLRTFPRCSSTRPSRESGRRRA